MTDHRPPPAKAGHPIAILCVDDETDILSSLKRTFRKEPFQVLTATSGREGLEILQSTPDIGLILSDHRMPQMSGTDFLEAARTVAPDVSRMILTGYADANAAVEAINRGEAYRYLSKPWHDDELLQAVRDGLQRYRLSRENQRLQAALQTSEARLQLAFQAAREGIWDWNLETDEVYYSLRYKEMLGYSDDEVEPHVSAWQRLLHPDDRESTNRMTEKLLRGEPPYEMEFRLRHKEGHYVPILSRGIPVRRESDNRIVRIVGTHFDLTERKLAEWELMQARDEAVRANRVKSAFLANMSHELRTPLTAVIGFTETLKDGLLGEISPAQTRALTSIDTSSRYLLSLINDVLDLAKVEADRMTVLMDTVSVQDICTSSMLFIREESFTKRINTFCTMDRVPNQIFTDPRRIKQILINLLSNAVKFTPEGGEIELSVTGLIGEGKLQFTVRDSGIGISTEDQALLFQPFSQIDNSLTRSHKGTGLGLALVKRIASLLGGEVSLVSEPGQGSRFTVTLPCRECDEDFSESTETGATSGAHGVAPPLRPCLTLMADDNAAVVEFTTEYLTEKGFRVMTAVTGIEAVELTRRERPGLILMDIQMPERSGLEAIREIRNFPPPDNRVPIIALTALAMSEDRDLCLEAGADLYLSKPFSGKELLLHIANVQNKEQQQS